MAARTKAATAADRDYRAGRPTPAHLDLFARASARLWEEIKQTSPATGPLKWPKPPQSWADYGQAH